MDSDGEEEGSWKHVNILHPLSVLTGEDWDEQLPLDPSDCDFVFLNNKWFASTRHDEVETGLDDPKVVEVGRVFASPDLESWSELSAPSCCFTLSNFNSHLVIVGGKEDGNITNKLWSSSDGAKWELLLPPMLTKRSRPTALSSRSPEECLIVAGGCSAGGIAEKFIELNVVEVLKEEQWFEVPAPLPLWSIHSSAAIHEGQVYFMSPKSYICHCPLESLLAATKNEPHEVSTLWNKFNAPNDTSRIASFGQQLIATGGSTKVFAYTPSSKTWVHVQNYDLEHIEDYSYGVGFLSAHELFLQYNYLKYDFVTKTFKMSLKAYPFEDWTFNCTVFRRLEAMGIPIVTALKDSLPKLKELVGVEMFPYDEIHDEPWENFLTKWVNTGSWGEYKYSPTYNELLQLLGEQLGYKKLRERIENFFGEFKSLQARCMSVIVSAMLEQRATDPDELCSKLPDYVPTVTVSDIADACWEKWVRPTSDFSSDEESPPPPERSTPSHEAECHGEVSPQPNEAAPAVNVRELPSGSPKPLPEKLPASEFSTHARSSLSPNEQPPLTKKTKM